MTCMKHLLTIMLSGTLLASTSANAAKPGDLEAGRQKAQTCAACHGPDGNSENPIYPIIANQYRDYLAQALIDYRSGQRNNAIMRGFAAGLSDEDILDLALYFSEQPSALATPDPE
jgi:cytochrome c553